MWAWGSGSENGPLKVAGGKYLIGAGSEGLIEAFKRWSAGAVVRVPSVLSGEFAGDCGGGGSRRARSGEGSPGSGLIDVERRGGVVGAAGEGGGEAGGGAGAHEGGADGVAEEVVDEGGLAEADFGLGGVDVDVDLLQGACRGRGGRRERRWAG